jgi:Lipocalin-like domain
VCAEALEKEEDMNRRSVLTKSVPIVLAAALLPSSVVAQQKSIKDQLVGTWIFVSAQDVKPDGSKVDPWGPNPKGAAMYDVNGRFTFMIMRSDLPKFASNNRGQATGEEGKAVAQGMIAFYGTYTVNEGDKTVTTRIEGSSYPNLIGAEQKRVITSLTADELQYTNPTTSTGTKAEAVWRRAK